MDTLITSFGRPAGRLSLHAALLVGAAAVFGSTPALAVGTAAGTVIENTATATFEGPSGPINVPSNQVTVTVDELIDPVVTSDNPGDVAAISGSTKQVQTFTLTNNGNGPESFALTTVYNNGGDDFDPTANSIVIDSNNNGVYDEGVDTIYVPGTNDPQLAADASVTIFVLSDIPATAGDGDRGNVELVASAKTGTGAPGDSFAGQGEGGGDAVLGISGGTGNDDSFFVVSAATLAFAKSASISDPFGGNEAVPGAIITYTLTASATGSGSLTGVVISDNIPAGTIYEVGTMTLNTAALTDAASDDAGTFNGTGISVNIGAMTGGDVETVTFKVKIED